MCGVFVSLGGRAARRHRRPRQWTYRASTPLGHQHLLSVANLLYQSIYTNIKREREGADPTNYNHQINIQ
jgi:hypothetical protein